MRLWWLVFAAGAVSAAAVSEDQQGSEAALSVGVVRFYSPRRATTTFEGVSELRLPGPGRAGAPAATEYRFEVAVFDSAGLELERSAWNRVLPASVAGTAGATVVESFSFAAAGGTYRVRVRAVPAGGTAVEREIATVAYAARPTISDLLIATAVRRPASDTEAAWPGEVRRAGLAMRTAPLPRRWATDAALTYYAELYPWPGAPTDAELRVEVIAGERVMVGTSPRAVRVEADGGLTRGTIDLAGLPPGDYRLRLRMRLGDSTSTAEAPFSMSAAPPAAEVGESAGDAFARASEARLDSLYGPLAHVGDPGELGAYANLTTEGKRRFLREFWRRRNPTPDSPDNPAMADFYRAVAYVNQAFREGGSASIPGWRTDRGRIFLKNGRPDEVLRRPLADPRPYEAWRYTRERPRYYVFYDQSGFGHYILLGTNDRRETGLPDWEPYLGADGLEDVTRFLQLQRP